MGGISPSKIHDRETAAVRSASGTAPSFFAPVGAHCPFDQAAERELPSLSFNSDVPVPLRQVFEACLALPRRTLTHLAEIAGLIEGVEPRKRRRHAERRGYFPAVSGRKCPYFGERLKARAVFKQEGF